MNYERFIKEQSALRRISPLRAISAIYARSPPGTVFMGGGMPNEGTFPFSKITVDLKDQSSIIIEGRELDRALQYQGTSGVMSLMDQLKQLQTRKHNLPKGFWDTRSLLITTGSQDGLCKAVEMCMEPGDPAVIQEPAYAGTLEAFRPFRPRFIPATTTDAQGVCPRKLRALLEKEGTPEEIRSKKSGVPKLMYLNPTGDNPAGTTLSLERKKEIYKLACEYDLVIIEDDPYYFLYFDGEEAPPSFMSMDTEGRVLRLDSFSKVLSAGLRLGFVTGPKELVERIELHIQVSIMHSSALPQYIVTNLLQMWGNEGFDAHVQYLKGFYRGQRDTMVAAAEKHLKGLAEWTVPSGGMFMWLRILGVADVARMVNESGLEYGILVVPGNVFTLDDSKPCSYVRASYSSASKSDIDQGFKRLANLIREEMKLQKKSK